MGHAEFATFQPSTRNWTIASPNGARVVQFGAPGDIPVPGHYDGGTKAEIAVFRPSNGTWYIIGPSGGRAVPFGQAGDIPVPGDYDGDGKTDLAIYRPSDGTWSIWKSKTQTVQVVQFGSPGLDEPVPAAYDGGGITEIAVLRPSTYQWFIIGPTGARVFQFGFTGTIPVPAPYNGGGKADLAIYDPASSTFYDANSGLVQHFGAANLDQPSPADFDGDGKTDIAVFRPNTAEWFVINSKGGSTHVQWGHWGIAQTLKSLAASTISIPSLWTTWIPSPGAESAGGFGPVPTARHSLVPILAPRPRRLVIQGTGTNKH